MAGSRGSVFATLIFPLSPLDTDALFNEFILCAPQNKCAKTQSQPFAARSCVFPRISAQSIKGRTGSIFYLFAPKSHSDLFRFSADRPQAFCKAQGHN
jgi:hypothetical protein